MIDPVNRNQNQQNQMNNPQAAQPQNQAGGQVFNGQNNIPISSVKPELGPVVDSTQVENQDFENQPMAESSGEFADPNVSGEVKDMIKVKKEFPEIDHGAKQAGVSERIPTGPVYGNFPSNLQAAQAQYDEKSEKSSDKWRALEAIKNFMRNLNGQTKPTEV